MNEPIELISNGVVVGRDGWLFLMEGSNEVGRLFKTPQQVLGDKVVLWVDLLLERKRRINALGAQYLHFWVPDKLSVYSEFVPDELGLSMQRPASLVMLEGGRQELKDITVDILPRLLEAKAEHLVYWKTDSHWTYQGAYDGYEVVCKALNTQPRAGLKTRPSSTIEMALDLGGKFTPPIVEYGRFHQVLVNSRVTYKNEIVCFLDLLAPKFAGEMHVGASVNFDNNSPQRDRRRVLLFGDSFSEYRPHLFSALMAETFENVKFVWSANIDYRLVEQFRPDIVITEMTERFIRRLPVDNVDLSELPYLRIADFLNLKCRDRGGIGWHWTYAK